MSSISVLTTLYNHEQYIGEALETALSQTRPPDEIVVLNDGSTDDSAAVVRRFDHPSIRLLEERHNLGGINTVKALRQCKGEYIAILNSDDAWKPEKLRVQARYLDDHPGCGAVFTWPQLVDERGVAWTSNNHPLYGLFHQPNRGQLNWLRHFFVQGNVFCASSAVIRRSCFETLGPFDSRFVQLQDFEMWVRIAAAGYAVTLIEEELTIYRISSANKNMSSNTRETRTRETYEYARLLQNFWRIKTANSLFAMFPESDMSRRPDDALVKFYLAFISRAQNTPHHHQFAVDCMFEVGGNAEAMERAADLFGFSHADYRDFIAQNPLGSHAESRLSHRIKTALWALPNPLRQSIRRMRDWSRPQRD